MKQSHTLKTEQTITLGEAYNRLYQVNNCLVCKGIIKRNPYVKTTMSIIVHRQCMKKKSRNHFSDGRMND